MRITKIDKLSTLKIATQPCQAFTPNTYPYFGCHPPGTFLLFEYKTDSYCRTLVHFIYKNFPRIQQMT